MSNTANLVLPYLAVGQAQKHVTVNESLRKLDAIIQLSVVSATTTAQPGSPLDGEVWILPSGKSGADWSAFANGSLAYYRDGAWVELGPREGWLAFVKDTDQLLAYSGASWSLFPAGKILRVSATDKLVGRSSSGAGAAEEIDCTAAGRALIDDADAAAQRVTLGLGTAAVQNIGTSGANVPLLNGANTHSGSNAFSSNVSFNGYTQFTGASEAYYDFNAYGVSANLKLTRLVTNAAGLQIAFLNDDYSGYADVFQITRSANTPTGFNFGADVKPMADNTCNLGSASFRFATVYAATSTINTSDAREKTALRPLEGAERRAIARVMKGVGAYRRLDAVAAKGEAARLHVGVTAQSVAEAFAAEGLDASRYGLFCADPVVEAVEIEEASEASAALREANPGAGEMRATKRVRREERPVVDANGSQDMRLGVRYDQLFAMALATLFAD